MTEPSYLPSDNPRVPAAAHPFRHCLPVQLRFTDIDMLGHVNNNVYLTFMDLAKVEYFQAVHETPVSPEDMRIVVVNIECDFLSPSFIGDNLEVWTQTTHIGNRSIRLEQRVVDRNTGVTKCIGRTVMAGFDPRTSTGADLDPEWVRRTEEFEQRNLREK